YRYKCATENVLVWETRTLAQGPPTVCANEGSSLIANTITIVDTPIDIDDLVITSTVNFEGADIQNLSHTHLQDIGANTHAQIDTHIADASKHRTINDSGTSAVD